MKKNHYISLIMMAFVCMLSLSFAACSDDDDDTSAPVVSIDEANIEGNELCIMADIEAKGTTQIIVANIFDSTGKSLKATKAINDSKYIGVLNIDDLHVHVDITGKGIVVGDLLKLLVIDANGSSTTAQKAITAEVDDDHDHD